MRESFIFYDSFLEAIDELDPKTKLEVYEAISHYALRGEEQNLTGISKAIFSLIKPQIDANNKRYENGKKGAGFGKLGGRPKNENPKETPKKPQENPKETPNVNVNENENVNENVNVFPPISPQGEKEKKEDIFINPVIENFSREYQKVFKTRPPLMKSHREKVLELNRELDDFKETIPDVLTSLKNLNFPDVGFKPNIMWLLKDDNYIKVKLGEFTAKKEKSILDFMYDEKDLVTNG